VRPLLSHKPDRWLLLLMGFSVFAWAPLLAPGYFFQAHDARHSVFFLVEFDAAVRDGAWWPRWTPDQALGYGYPLWIFYSPFAYYVAEAFHVIGLGFTAAVKATYALSFVTSAWAMYWLVRRWWGPPAGFIAGLVYLYAPYHLVDVYVRSALAESVAFVWYPLVLLAFDDLIERWGDAQSGRRLALAALAYAALILTHSVTGLVFTPLLGAFILLRLTQRAKPLSRLSLRQLISLAGPAAVALGLALGLSAIFLIPMVLERNYIVQAQWVHDTYQYQRHFVYPNQLLSSFWGFGYSVEGPNDGVSFQLGLMPVILSVVAAVAALRANANRRGLVWFFVMTTLGAVAMMLPPVRPVWDALPLVGLVQFPWRLLAVATVTTAILSGAAVAQLATLSSEDGTATATVCVLALVVLLASYPYTRPEYTPVTPRDESPLAIIDFETQHPDMVGITHWARLVPAETPLLEQYLAGKPLEKVVVLRGQGRAETVRYGGASVEAQVDAVSDVTVQFRTYWFPGWQARIDGKKADSRPEGEYGLLTMDVPAGQHRITIRMGSTPDRMIGTLVSAVSLMLVLGCWLTRCSLLVFGV